MTLTEFKTQFPEFRSVPDPMLTAHLNAAALECSEEVWGTLLDQGIAYLAAHKMALSPYGNTAKLSNASGGSTYFTHYADLVRKVAQGCRNT